MAEMKNSGDYVASPIPGPCYPNFPDLRSAFAVHRLDAESGRCRYCKAAWPVKNIDGTDRG